MKGKRAARAHELLADKDLDLHVHMKELMYGRHASEERGLMPWPNGLKRGTGVECGRLLPFVLLRRTPYAGSSG